MEYYVSIDIGGTAMKYGVIESADAGCAKIIQKNQMDTEAQKGGPKILQKVIQIVQDAVDQYPICGICISTAGMVDTQKGEIFYAAPLIPNYTGTKFKEILEKQFQIPCEVENDVNCAGLAERTSGAAAGSAVTLCLTIGTGIGGCILIGDEVFHGFSNSACEVGYMKMLGGDFQKLGAASILTKKVMARKAAEQMDAVWHAVTEGGANADGQAKNISGDRDIWDGYRIFKEAKAGDAICIQAIDEMADVLGCGIANICYVINPEVVVLGGGIMAQEEYLRPRIEKAVCRYLVESIAQKTTIAFAKHRNDAGMLGAYYNYRKRQG